MKNHNNNLIYILCKNGYGITNKLMISLKS